MREKTMFYSCTIMSFGFKYGLPNANYYFDVGFAKNPARQKDVWSFFSEPDPLMIDYVLDQKDVKKFIDLIVPLIVHLSKLDQHQVFAFGCNAGRHRSHIIAEKISKILKEKDVEAHVYHRDSRKV